MAQGESSGHPRMAAGYPSHSEEQKGLKESAQELAARAGEAAGQMKDKAREFASGMQGRAEEAWRGAREGFSRVSERAGDFWGDATEIIRRYPVASLAIAFGLGCLTACAFAFMPRKDDMTERMSRASS